MSERNVAYLKNLMPNRDPIVFMRPGRCTGFWLDKEAKGCGHVVRIHYMRADTIKRRRKAPPDAAVCPICGERYLFAFYKMKADDGYQPSAEEEQDIRKLYADLKRMAGGKEPRYDLPLEERIRIHSLAPPVAPAEAQA